MSDYATTFTSSSIPISSVKECFPLKRFPDVATVFTQNSEKYTSSLRISWKEFPRGNTRYESDPTWRLYISSAPRG
jgi:hypothetical protein